MSRPPAIGNAWCINFSRVERRGAVSWANPLCLNGARDTLLLRAAAFESSAQFALPMSAL